MLKKLGKKIILCNLVVLITALQSYAQLNKKDALAELKKNGFKWQQTHLFSEDAKAKLSQAQSAFYPHLSASWAFFYGRINPIKLGLPDVPEVSSFGGGTVRLIMEYSAFDLSVIDRLHAAKENEKYSDATKQQYQNDLTYLMLAQYLNAQRLKRKIETLDANITRDSEFVKIAESRVQTGTGIKLDIIRAKTLLESDNLKKIDATLSWKQALQDLALTLGTKQLTEELEPLAYRELPEKMFDVQVEKIISERADLVSAEKGIEALRKLRDAEHDEVFPKVIIFADTGYAGTNVFGDINKGLTYTVGFRVTAPIFNAGLLKAKEQEEGVKVIRAELQKRQLDLEAEAQLNSTISKVKETKKAIELTINQVSMAQEDLNITKKRFLSGAANGIELSNTQVNYASASDSHIDAIFAYEMSKVNFFKALGSFEKYFELEGQQTP